MPATSKEPTRLGDIMLAQGIVTLGKLHEAVCKQFNTDKRLGEIMVNLGIATTSQVNAALSEQKYRREKPGN